MKKAPMIPPTKNAPQPKPGETVNLTLSQFLDIQIQQTNALLSNLFKARDAAAQQEKMIEEAKAKDAKAT